MSLVRAFLPIILFAVFIGVIMFVGLTYYFETPLW